MLAILDTGIGSAEQNMSLDQRLLNDLSSSDEPLLHFYEWAVPSATYGYFIQPQKHLNLQACEKAGLDLARRPTGGGIVFHIWDFAFSFLLPSEHPRFSLNTLENYQFVNSVVLEMVQEVFSLPSVALISENGPALGPDCQNFCMAKPTQYDVVHGGMKVAGAAERRKAQGYLHQGTVSLGVPQFDLLKSVLLSHQDVLMAMNAYTFAPIQNPKELPDARSELKKVLAAKLKAVLD